MNSNSTLLPIVTSTPDDGSNNLSPFNLMISTMGTMPTFIGLIGVRATIATIGLVCNSNLIWVTFKTKSLHGACNVLIAMLAFANMLFELGLYVSFGVVLNGGRNLIRLDTCFAFQFIPVFGKMFALTCMPLIALDRLRSLALPWLLGNNKKPYLMCCFGLCSSVSIYVLYISYMAMQPIPGFPTMCTASEISQNGAASITYYIGLCLNALSPCTYAVLTLFILAKNKSIPANSKSRRVFKSIIVLMLMELFGWGMNSMLVCLTALGLVQLQSSWNSAILSSIFGYPMYLAAALNAVTLFFCSSDYRTAFKAHFKVISVCMRSNYETTEPVFVSRTSQKHKSLTRK